MAMNAQHLICSNYSDGGMEVEFYIEDTVSNESFYVSSQYVFSDPEHFLSSLIEFLDDAVVGQDLVSLGDREVSLHTSDGDKAYSLEELEDECSAEVFVETLHSFLNENS